MKVFKWLLIPIFLLIWYVAPVLSISVFIWLIELISNWWTIVLFFMFTIISAFILWLSMLLPSVFGNLLILLYQSKWVKYMFSIVGAVSLFSIISTIKYNPQIRLFFSFVKDIADESLIKGGLLYLLVIEFAFILLYLFILTPLFINIEKSKE